MQLCRQYFRDYDFNKNSFLDDAELMALARDLSERLEVPLKSSKELKESIGQFSDNGSDCLSFGEFARWFATMMGLEEPMMKEIGEMASEDLWEFAALHVAQAFVQCAIVGFALDSSL